MDNHCIVLYENNRSDIMLWPQNRIKLTEVHQMINYIVCTRACRLLSVWMYAMSGVRVRIREWEVVWRNKTLIQTWNVIKLGSGNTWPSSVSCQVKKNSCYGKNTFSKEIRKNSYINELELQNTICLVLRYYVYVM